MHIYQQRHLTYQQNLLHYLQGNWWWPTMGLCDIQFFLSYDCPSCCRRFDHIPKNIICGSVIAQSHDNRDWRRLLIEYLTYGYLKGPHISKGQHKRIARQSREYFIEEGKLRIILTNGDIKICIAGHEVNEYLQELHVTDSKEHLSMETTWHLAMFGPYWWPTCGADIKDLCNWKCPKCSNQIWLGKEKVTQTLPGEENLDWRRPYLEYLTCRKIFDQALPPEVKRAVEQSHKHFVFTNGTLQRIRKGGKSNQICIPETQVPIYLAKTHGESEPHLAAIETWKAVATGAYWWPTWGHDVCNYLRYCKICRGAETREKHPEESQNPTPPITTPEPDWRRSITQPLESFEESNYVGTHENLGLLSLDTETYFITNDGLKYRLSNGEVKMCITREDAIDWVKRVHEYQVSHLTKEEAFFQVHKGPYWWPTISLDVRCLIDECKICQVGAMLCLQKTKYETIPSRGNETHDWREPIIQHLKYPMELSKLDFQEELGILKDGIPNYFLEEDILNRRLPNRDIKLCITRGEGIEWLTTIHNQRSPHLSMDEMISQVTSGPYWWPTIPPDIDHLCRNCMHCWPKESPKHVIDCRTVTSKENEGHDWRTPFIDYLTHGRLTTEASIIQRQQIAIHSRPFMLNQNGTLIKEGPDGIRRTCVAGPVTTAIIAEAHEGIAGGHFSAKIILHKILTALYWWPSLKKGVYLYCTQCDICQRIGPKISTNLQPLHPTMPTKVFQKWGLDFIGPVNPPAKGTRNRYIITATDYTTKWVEARALRDNMAKSTAKFLSEEIITKFGCPLEFVSDQGSHFINDTIKVLAQEFMIIHRKLTTYYPQANDQVESTNKLIKITLTKMVNAD